MHLVDSMRLTKTSLFLYPKLKPWKPYAKTIINVYPYIMNSSVNKIMITKKQMQLLFKICDCDMKLKNMIEGKLSKYQAGLLIEKIFKMNTKCKLTFDKDL